MHFDSINAKLLVGLVALSLALQASHPLARTSEPTPTCTHCRAKLQTLSALRNALPSDWRVQLEREPVLDSEVLTVQAGEAHPRTLLLVHGLGNNGFTDWLTVMPQLARQYHVIALDLPGFGYSASQAASIRLPTMPACSPGSSHVTATASPSSSGIRWEVPSCCALRATTLCSSTNSCWSNAVGMLHRTAFIKHGARVPQQYGEIPLLKDPGAPQRLYGQCRRESLFPA